VTVTDRIRRVCRRPGRASWWLASLLVLLTLLGHDTTVAVASHGPEGGPSPALTRIDHRDHAVPGHVWLDTEPAAPTLPADTACLTSDHGVLPAGIAMPDTDAADPVPLVACAIAIPPMGTVAHPPAQPPDVRRALIQVWLN